MEKTYCDRCGNEIVGGRVWLHVEYNNPASDIGKDYSNKDLCKSCLKIFVETLNSFISNFMDTSN